MPRYLPINLLNDASEEIVYIRKNRKLLNDLTKRTHFNINEIEALALVHRAIRKKFGPIARTTFRDVVHAGLDYTENIRHLLVDRVFSAIDVKNVLQLNADQWIEGLSILLCGNLNEKINFAYNVYDLVRTNKIKREQIFPMLRGCLINLGPDEDPDDAVRDFIEIMMKTIDVDRDGKITEQDFTTAVKRDGLLLECMGPVFPSRQAANTFLTTIT
ncbi:EF-hand calcium-binding domain-containing protein 1-like, partial [Aphidius gifuensis]